MSTQASLMRRWLDHWHHVLDAPGVPRFEEPNDMAGVLADLRRHPPALDEAFAPLPKGNDILQRIRHCVSSETDHSGMYLIPDAVSLEDDTLRELVLDSLGRGHGVLEEPVPDYRIDILRRAMRRDERATSAPMVEGLGDLLIDVAYAAAEPENVAMQFLWETLYTLAASFAVVGWCSTPLCPDEIRSVDPWRPQMELWRVGARAVVRWDGDSQWIAVYTT